MPSSSSWAQSIINQGDVFVNIAKSIDPVEHLITAAAYLMGVVFAIKALQSLKQLGENKGGGQHSGIKEPVLYFLVSSAMLYFPSMFSILMNTTFGYSSVLAYAPVNSNSVITNSLFGSGSEVGAALAKIIQLIGLIAFIKGWLLISKSAQQGQGQGNTGKGITHIFGGVLAMNIIGTLQILNNTLYGAN